MDSDVLRPLRWNGGTDGYLQLLDQTLLPGEVQWIACRSVQSVFDAIRRLAVRGAPAIGVAAAYGVVLGLHESVRVGGAEEPIRPAVKRICDVLVAARPTAVNLAWALRRMQRAADACEHLPQLQARERLLDEAHAIRNEDAAMCRAIGEVGQHLIADGAGVMTHCNAGALATAEYGTALAPMYAAHARGRRFRVWVDETRPLLQGARLTAWELSEAGIDATLICDNMSAAVMRDGQVRLIIVGADRIAANGDTANKIGTYGLSILARHHGIPFYVAAPPSTLDTSLATGAAIPIEQRDAAEIRRLGGRDIAPRDMPCFNPAFDVTPAAHITGIIMPTGIISPVNADTLALVDSAAGGTR